MLHAGAPDDWEEHERLHLPAEVLPLRLFQCRQAIWRVAPGLHSDKPTRLILPEFGGGDDESEDEQGTRDSNAAQDA
ncbi:MAG: hypothetical protein KatS3mg052_2640 [Candidatus Roseilinea sp.]|nr:MAG: hypothetical protein KatS3mg052_2640 [Candidatus Roseilinea sp.]